MRPDYFRQFIEPLALVLVEQALLDSQEYKAICPFNNSIGLRVFTDENFA
jgi:hypothetical protein